MLRLSRRVVLYVLTAAALSLGVAGVALAAHHVGFRHVHGAAARQQAFRALVRAKAHRAGRQAHATSSSARGIGDSDLALEEAQYGLERTAPALTVSGQALIAAGQQASGMRVTGGLLVTSARAAGAGPSTRVSVKPGSGGPRTHFTVTFRVPVAVGTFASVARRDTVSVKGPHGTRCVASASATLRKARKGARAKLTLRSGAASRGGWCAGVWNGTVVQTVVPRCTPAPTHACPVLVVRPQTLARFRFRVKAAPRTPPPTSPGADVPTFAGLVSATTCPSLTPRPLVLPRPNSYTLTWKAATDPVTPSSRIVYDIFVATTSGAENYAQPSWTTAPGATSFVTPASVRTSTLFFVVRARNAAGHEDHNTVEREGVTQCP